jgi:WD40 repeat protein
MLWFPPSNLCWLAPFLVLFHQQTAVHARGPDAPLAKALDLYGASLPEGALVRLGTTRWRENSGVRCLAVAPDGKTLAVGGTWEIGIWDLANGRQLHSFSKDECYNWGVAFGPDGKELYGISQSSAIKVWNAATGKPTRRLHGHTWVITQLAVSADGKIMISRAVDNTLRVWEPAAGKEILRLDVPGKATADHIALAPNGKLMVVAGNSPQRVLDVATGKERRLLHTKISINDAAFAPDNRTLAFASYRHGIVECWDAIDGKKIIELQAGSENHVVKKCVFAPDGRTLAAIDDEHKIWLWDWRSGKTRHILDSRCGSLEAVIFSPDGKKVIAGGGTGLIHFWETDTGREIPTEAGHYGSVASVAVFPDGRAVATAGTDQTVRFWDAQTGQERQRFDVAAAKNDILTLASKERLALVSKTADTPSILALARGKQRITRLDGPRALSPDWQLFVEADWRESAREDEPAKLIVRDRTTGKVVRAFAESVAENLAFRPDGKIVANGGYDEALTLWEVDTGKRLARFQFQGALLNLPGFPPDTRVTAAIAAAAFSPDGAFLAAGVGNDLVLLDPTSGKEVVTRVGHSNTVSSLAFSPDGRLLATVAGGSDFHVWETATLE